MTCLFRSLNIVNKALLEIFTLIRFLFGVRSDDVPFKITIVNKALLAIFTLDKVSLWSEI